MSLHSDVAQWVDVYLLETTDEVLGGVAGPSNTATKQLADRTARIKLDMAKQGLYINDDTKFEGINSINAVTFDAGVSDGEPVYYNNADQKFYQAVSDGTAAEKFVGVADVTNSKVISNGIIYIASPSFSIGQRIYLDVTTPGLLTTSSAGVYVGKHLYDGLIVLAGADAQGATSITASMIVDDEGILNSEMSYQNQLRNTDFQLWSNSGLDQGVGVGGQSGYHVGGELIFAENINAEDNQFGGATNWLVSGTTAMPSGGWSVSGGSLVATSVATPVAFQLTGFTVGKLYKFQIICNGVTDGYCRLDVRDSGRSNILFRSVISSSGASLDMSVIFKATGTTHWIEVNQAINNLTATFDNASCYEVVPACIGANTLAPDTWSKDSGMLIYREEDINVDGSFYAAKLVASGGVKSFKRVLDTVDFKKFNGRTVTIGCWVKTTDGTDTSTGNALLQSTEDGGTTTRATSTQTDNWQWLEGSFTIGTNTTTLNPFVLTVASGKTVYISQPMLVFGNTLGEGMYSRNNCDLVTAEQVYPVNGYNYGSMSNETISVNLEGSTSGKIGAGVKGANVYLRGVDSNSAVTSYFSFGNLVCETSGKANNSLTSQNGFVAFDADGMATLVIAGSGATTFAIYANNVNDVLI